MSFLHGTDPGLRQTRTPTVDTFAAGVGFTAGSSTYVTLSVDCGTEASLITTFDGITQHRDTYSYDTSNRRVTFDAAIPTGVSKIECTYTTTIPATTPADGSVTQAKLGDEAVNEAKLQVSNAPTNGYFLSAQSGNTGGLTWAEAGGGKVLQRVTASTNAIVTGTTQITLDDSIPQNNEGVEVETCAITPTASASRLLIFANMTFAWSARGNVQVALFQDTTANAISAVTNLSEADGTTHTVTLIYEMEAGTTSSTTFKVRIGAESSGTLTLNGLGGARKLGGAARSGIEILEIEA